MMRAAPLKRTPFASKPKAPKPARAPRITHKRGTSSIWRSDAYLALVRSLPCSKCGRHEYTQAAHSNQMRMGKSRGMKASDASVMPLCGPEFMRVGCHAELDQGKALSKDQRKRFEDQHICKTIYWLIGDNRLISAEPLPAMYCGFDEMAARLVAMIESGELRINQR